MPRWLCRLALIAFWLLLAVIVFSTLSPISLRPRTGHLHVERITAFVLLGGAFTLAYPARRLLALAVTTGLAAGLEIAQTLDPTRHGRLPDALEKMAGAALGVALASLVIAWLRNQTLKSRPSPRMGGPRL